MAYIKLFFASNDVQVSEAPTTTNAVSFTLRADLNEVGSGIRLYALADDGYLVSGVSITPTGTTYEKWDLATDAAGSIGSWQGYGSALSVGLVNDTDKSYFWTRAKATDDETPVNDTSVTLVASGIAYAE